MGFEVVAKPTKRGPEAAGPVRVRGPGSIIIASEVAAQVGMAVGDHVRLLAGNGPDFGRWAIEKANDGYVLFRPKRSKDLIVTCRAIGKAINSPRLPVTAVEYKIVGGVRLIITLPKQPALQAAE